MVDMTQGGDDEDREDATSVHLDIKPWDALAIIFQVFMTSNAA